MVLIIFSNRILIWEQQNNFWNFKMCTFLATWRLPTSNFQTQFLRSVCHVLDICMTCQLLIFLFLLLFINVFSPQIVLFLLLAKTKSQFGGKCCCEKKNMILYFWPISNLSPPAMKQLAWTISALNHLQQLWCLKSPPVNIITQSKGLFDDLSSLPHKVKCNLVN